MVSLFFERRSNGQCSRREGHRSMAVPHVDLALLSRFHAQYDGGKSIFRRCRSKLRGPRSSLCRKERTISEDVGTVVSDRQRSIDRRAQPSEKRLIHLVSPLPSHPSSAGLIPGRQCLSSRFKKVYGCVGSCPGFDWTHFINTLNVLHPRSRFTNA